MFARCGRIKDAWYSNVIDECRDGELREDTYNFLHGYFTHECGSSLLGQDSSCDCQLVVDAALSAHRDAWIEGRAQKSSVTICEDTVEKPETKPISLAFFFDALSDGEAEEVDLRVPETHQRERELLSLFQDGWKNALGTVHQLQRRASSTKACPG